MARRLLNKTQTVADFIEQFALVRNLNVMSTVRPFLELKSPCETMFIQVINATSVLVGLHMYAQPPNGSYIKLYSYAIIHIIPIRVRLTRVWSHT